MLRKLSISYVFTLVMLTFAASFLSSCEDKAITNLKKQVAMTNSQCPINGGSAGDLISVKYNEKDNIVGFYWAINEESTTIDFLRTSEEDVRNQLKLMFQERSSREMLKDLVKAQASLNIVYKSPSTGKTVQFLLSKDDLSEIQNSPLMSDDERMRIIVSNQVKLENKRCPYKVDEGIRMTKVDLVNENVVYYYEMDEDLYDIHQLQYSEDEMVKELKDCLKTGLRTNAMLQNIVKKMTKLNIGIQYRYYGNKSQKTFDVIVTPEELYHLHPRSLR